MLYRNRKSPALSLTDSPLDLVQSKLIKFSNVLSSKMIHLFLKNTAQYHDVSQLKLQRKISKFKWNSHKILTLQLRYVLPVFWYYLWEYKIILIKWLWESEPKMKGDNSGLMTHSWVGSSILLWWLVLSLSSSVSSCPRQCCLHIVHILCFVLPFCELHTLPSFSIYTKLSQTG